MRNFGLFIGVALLISLGNACTERCLCNETDCAYEEGLPSFTFTATVGTATGNFTTQEMAAFEIYRIDQNLNRIDTLPISFLTVGGNPNHNRIYSYLPDIHYIEVTRLIETDFIIHNTLTRQSDTIIQINYTEETKEVTCARCSGIGCEDIKELQMLFTNATHNLNGVGRSGLELHLVK